MKKSIPTWAWIVIVILALTTIIFLIAYTNEKNNYVSFSQQSENPTTNFLTYDSPAYGIRIKYPSDWGKDEQFMGTVVALYSPTESSSDTFAENLNIIIQALSKQPMTLSEYTDLSVNQLSQIVTDIDIIDSSATTLDGNPAHKLVYTGKQGQYNLKYMQVWAIKDNKAYIVTYTAEVDKYSNYLNTINQMVNSFEIIT